MRRHSPVLALACEVAPERMPRGAAFIGYCQDESCTLSQWHDISCNAELSCVCQEGGQVWGVSERMNQIHDDLKAEGGSYREGLECEDGVWRDDGDDWDRGADGSWAVGLIGPIIGLLCTALWITVGARARAPARPLRTRRCPRVSHARPPRAACVFCCKAQKRQQERNARLAEAARNAPGPGAYGTPGSAVAVAPMMPMAVAQPAGVGMQPVAMAVAQPAGGGMPMAMATATPGGAMPMATAVAVAAPGGAAMPVATAYAAA